MLNLQPSTVTSRSPQYPVDQTISGSYTPIQKDIYVVEFNPLSHLRPPEPSLCPCSHVGAYAQLKEREKIENQENQKSRKYEMIKEAKNIIAGIKPRSVKNAVIK